MVRLTLDSAQWDQSLVRTNTYYLTVIVFIAFKHLVLQQDFDLYKA